MVLSVLDIFLPTKSEYRDGLLRLRFPSPVQARSRFNLAVVVKGEQMLRVFAARVDQQRIFVPFVPFVFRSSAFIGEWEPIGLGADPFCRRRFAGSAAEG
jgi:hypothetical protein